MIYRLSSVYQGTVNKMDKNYAMIIYQYAVMGVPKSEIPGIEWNANWDEYYDRIYKESHSKK